jgi:hypothetical protein
MKIPFSTEQFLDVFGGYNSDVWPMQLAFYAFAMIALYHLFNNHPNGNRIINLMLATFWIWMGLIYHLMYFSQINPVAKGFGVMFIIQGAIFGYFGIIKDQIQYRVDATISSAMGILLVVYGLFIYPVLSHSLGHIYPEAPTFGLPCPTAIFTYGMLLFSKYRLAWYVYFIALLWSVIGFSASIALGMAEDLALGFAAVIALTGFVTKTRDCRRTVLPQR